MGNTTKFIQDVLRDPWTGETIRAFLLFGVLFFILAGIAGNLLRRQLDLDVMLARTGAAMEEAERVARAVRAIGRDRDGIDFSRLRRSRDALETVVNERLQTRRFVRYVEVRDRFGMQVAFVARDAGEGGPVALQLREPDTQLWPTDTAPEINLPLMVGSGDSVGEIRVGLSEDAVSSDLKRLRRSLGLQVIAAGFAGILILVIGLFYVLFLIRKNRRLEQSRLAAERRSYVGLLASGLAHEIRNPLNAMNMNLQMLEEELQLMPDSESAEFTELLDSTKSEIKRLEQLVSNFLAYARPSQPHFEGRDLNDVLQRICRFLEADFRKSDVRLEIESEPLLPNVEIDETQFRQAVMNLLVNARQVLRSGGTITVRTRASSGGEVEVEIEDDGPGIPEDARARIFEVFYSSRGGGTGLGLPIARQIVERHGGTIEVESAIDRGTTFRIRLPRRHAPSEEPKAAAAS